MSVRVTEHLEHRRRSGAVVALAARERIRELTAQRVPGTAPVVVLAVENMVQGHLLLVVEMAVMAHLVL
ncbi:MULTISPECIES: hypothetical protein [unclassified Citrobacter]|uniref:hypothetical protein n=1 Tax=Enterobacter roggenkampii TaxID=1812935 RepID=UPI0010C97E94|nr:hypothetical protein FDX10_03860 [Citrobacter sp. wls713]TKV00088.1 hypothetical protein FDX07_11710 [Citrobacter sp. wls621]